jgi:hypothetical protein
MVEFPVVEGVDPVRVIALLCAAEISSGRGSDAEIIVRRARFFERYLRGGE